MDVEDLRCTLIPHFKQIKLGGACSHVDLESVDVWKYIYQIPVTLSPGVILDASSPVRLGKEDRNRCHYCSIFLDYDSSSKIGWTDKSMAELAELATELHRENSAYCVYATTSGYRVVFLLNGYIPGKYYHKTVKYLVNTVPALHGYSIDARTLQVYWGFIPPRGVAFEEKYDECGTTKIEKDDHFLKLWPRTYVDTTDLLRKSIVKATALIPVQGIVDPGTCPSAQTASELLITNSGKDTTWFKRAKKELAKSQPVLLDQILSQQPLAEEGDRHLKCLRVSGILSKYSYIIPGTTHAHLIALVYPCLQKMGVEQDGTTNFVTKFWSMLQDDVNKSRAEKVANEYQQDLTISNLMQNASSDNPFIDERSLHPGDTLDQVSSRMDKFRRYIIAIKQGDCYVLGPDGYHPEPVRPTLIRAKAHQLGTAKFLERGEHKSVQDIIDKNAIVVDKVQMLPMGQVSPHGYIRNKVLHLPLYMLNPDVVPQYSEEVDTWLRHLSMNMYNYNRLLRWLAWAPDVDKGPICSLILVGDPGVGKGLLVQSLVDMFLPHGKGTDTVFQQYNTGLRYPIVHVDEGLSPGAKRSIQSVSDTVRTIIGGGEVLLDEKYRGQVTIHIRPRLVVTANNTDVVEDLVSSYAISATDADAISQRFMMIDTRGSKNAADYLQRLGGLEYTRKLWAGPGSHMAVAKHIMYISTTMDQKVSDGRFLVEGDLSENVVRGHMLNGLVGHAIFNAIVDIVNQTLCPNSMKPIFDSDKITSTGIVLTTDGQKYRIPNGSLAEGDPILMLTAQAVSDRLKAGHAGKVYSMQAILNVLSCLSHRGWPKTLSVGPEDIRGAKWYYMDLRLIMDHCKGIGKAFKLSTYISKVKGSRLTNAQKDI